MVLAIWLTLNTARQVAKGILYITIQHGCRKNEYLYRSQLCSMQNVAKPYLGTIILCQLLIMLQNLMYCK